MVGVMARVGLTVSQCLERSLLVVALDDKYFPFVALMVRPRSLYALCDVDSVRRTSKSCEAYTHSLSVKCFGRLDKG